MGDKLRNELQCLEGAHIVAFFSRYFDLGDGPVYSSDSYKLLIVVDLRHDASKGWLCWIYPVHMGPLNERRAYQES